MAEIRELGESLLARAKSRNERNFKRSRREAYRIATLTAGVGLFKNSLKQKTNDFLTSEGAMAARVRQRQGFEDNRNQQPVGRILYDNTK